MAKSLLTQIEENFKGFSKGQKRIASYVLENYDKAAFMTAAKLGENAQISESTVVRFAVELGFNGYQDFQKALQSIIKNKLTSVQRIEVTDNKIGENGVIDTILSDDIDMIRSTLESVSRDDFENAVVSINKAKKIYILGVRSSASLANFMAFYFNMIYENVILVTSSSESELFEQMFRISSDDVCIAISFPRYSRQTLNALRFAKDRGAKVISITDSVDSPIAPFADYLLIARSNMASFIDSLVAPLSLINALIVAATLSKKNEVHNNFMMLESTWEKYKVYEKNEEISEVNDK